MSKVLEKDLANEVWDVKFSLDGFGYGCCCHEMISSNDNLQQHDNLQQPILAGVEDLRGWRKKPIAKKFVDFQVEL